MKICTVFYRSIRHLSVDRQREICEPVAKQYGMAVEYTHGEHGGGERDQWITSTRKGEVAVVAHLQVIAEDRTKVKRPTVDFAVALTRLVQQCQMVVEAGSGITSRDGQKWDDAVREAGNMIASGRTLGPRRARSMAKKRWASAEPGVVKMWKSAAMAKAHKRWSQHWRDPVFRNDAAAFDAFPDELREAFGSTTTARRIFGPRRPGDPTAGGRRAGKRKTGKLRK